MPDLRHDLLKKAYCDHGLGAEKAIELLADHGMDIQTAYDTINDLLHHGTDSAIDDLTDIIYDRWDEDEGISIHNQLCDLIDWLY
mgnify:CR=1 FL=1